MKRAWIPIFLLLTSGACSQAVAPVENEGPDGGDGLVADFVSYGREISRTLKQVKRISGFPDDRLARIREKLPEVVLKTKVQSAERVFLDNGTEVTAKNYRAKGLIVVGRARWPELDDRGARHRLVLHEYLGVMSERETAYELTDALLTGIADLLELPPEQGGVGPFLISDCAEFQLRLSRATEGKIFVLANDIDCSGEEAFRPVPLFKGTLTGSDPEKLVAHEVRGIRIRSRAELGPTTLFAPFHVSSGVIRNVTFRDITIDTLGIAAGLVADNKGTIENVRVFASVQGSEIGGIAARNYGVIRDSSFDGLVDASRSQQHNASGGAVAQNFSELTNLRIRVKLTGTRNVGGVAGVSYGFIRKCAVEDSEISGEVNTGGIVGKNQAGTGDTLINDGVIEDCTSSGTVAARMVQPPADGRSVGNTGGIVGYNRSRVYRSRTSMRVCGPERESNLGLTSGSTPPGHQGLFDTESTGQLVRPCP